MWSTELPLGGKRTFSAAYHPDLGDWRSFRDHLGDEGADEGEV